MIYLTGDTHGTLDMDKLTAGSWPDGQMLTRDDYLIILGDFGAIWSGGRDDRVILSWYEAAPWTTLFVDGNHENHDLIDTFEVTERFGGRVQVVPGFPHVIHLMRGEIYDIPTGEGQTARCLVMGGARSIDRTMRIEGESWWAREMPSQEEYDRCADNLDRVGWSVDYVLTHNVPYPATVDAIGWNYSIMRRDPPIDELTGFLQWVDEKLDKNRMKAWYAGHYHVDRLVMDERHCVLYQSVLPLGELPSEGMRDGGV